VVGNRNRVFPQVVAMPDFVLKTVCHYESGTRFGVRFVTANGLFYPPERRPALQVTLKKQAFPNLSDPDQRHFCLLVYENTPKDVQTIVGHAQFSTTVDIYGHLMPEANREAPGGWTGCSSGSFSRRCFVVESHSSRERLRADTFNKVCFVSFTR
jgi:hypothetical protein